jgi:hypothetical protein
VSAAPVYDPRAIDAANRERRAKRFVALEAARVARQGAAPAAKSPAVHPWTANLQVPVPANVSGKRGPRTCGICGSREHDRRNHARVIAQETPTGILPPAPAPPVSPPVVSPPAAAPAPEAPTPPLAMAQEKARARAIQKGNGRALTLSPDYGVTERERKTFGLPLLTEEEEAERPRTREDCKTGPRPCPWVTCQHHLYLDVDPLTGSLKLNFPHLEVWEMAETCSLDVADRGGITLEEVGAILNLTRERIRQVEVRGLTRLKLNMQDGSGAG